MRGQFRLLFLPLLRRPVTSVAVTTYAINWFSPGACSRAMTTASATAGCCPSAASISPNSEAMAAHLHLLVQPSQKLELPIGLIARQVASAIEAGPGGGGKRIGRKRSAVSSGRW